MVVKAPMDDRNREKFVIGIDCGSLSARAALVRVSDGEVISSCCEDYGGGIITGHLPSGTPLPDDYVLMSAEDYISVIPSIIRGVLRESRIDVEQIIGIGVDSTSCTAVPCLGDGRVLSTLDGMEREPHAYIKMWKHHCVQPQVEQLEKAFQISGEDFLEKHCGGQVSGEWMLPKVLQIYQDSPDIYKRADYFFDLCDWLTFLMTGRPTRCYNSASFKGLWSPDRGDISYDILLDIDPAFAESYRRKALIDPVVCHGQRCGRLSAQGGVWLGLPAGIAVSAGLMDGHAAAIAGGMSESGDMAIIIGTSNAIPFVMDRFVPVAGLCGIVKGGIIPGLYGYTAGQSATGDMLSWFVGRSIPGEYMAEAAQRGVDIYSLLAEKAAQRLPEKNPLTVLDWWNGNRSILCDQRLSGTIWGLSLSTAPEDIYCAMIQAIACGTRVIIEQCEASRLRFRQITACGGIPRKNRFFMQQYANILNRPILVADIREASALGSAICAAAAAGAQSGGYDSLRLSAAAMCTRRRICYEPCAEQKKDYAQIYGRYCRLHDLLGGWNGRTARTSR